MSGIIHRDPRKPLPTAVRGQGVYLYDETGKQYLDACGGAAISCLGHSHRQVIAAIQTQVETLAFAHTGFFTNQPLEALGLRLATLAPGDLNHVQIVCGGSEAVEAALKLARQHMVDRGEPERVNLISRRRSYHGATLATLGIGESLSRKTPYLPMLHNGAQISPCYAYRGMQPEETGFDYGQRVANELETALLEAGPETVAAFILEPVVGASLGAVAPVAGYLKRIRQICDRYGVLLIFDEVMCGTGRTGTLFACEQEDVVPDILVMAKGLAAGYQAIGAVLARDHVIDTIMAKTGAFIHGHSFMGHATACAAAMAVLDVFEQEQLLGNVAGRGEQLRTLLGARLADHPNCGDIRGRGLFVGVEIVADRTSKQPFDPALKLSGKVKAACMQRGLMCYPGSGTADGYIGDHILLAPPYIITAGEVEMVADRFCAGFAEAARLASA